MVAATGFSVVVLARASFLMQKAASGPDDEKFLQELAEGSGYYSGEPVTCCDGIITASGPQAAKEFAEAVSAVVRDETAN